MNFFDTHTHLNDEKLFPTWRLHLSHFVDQGGVGLVNIGVDDDHNRKAIEIAREAQHEKLACRVKATIGYHPSEVCFGNITEENMDEKMSELEKLYTENKEYIIAIGECGIDVHYPNGAATIELQKKLFRKQCLLAQTLKLPIVIHSRDDFQSTFDIIKEFKNEKIYFHCYGYTAEEIKILRENFSSLWIGFCGNVTYLKAQPLRDALLACDIRNIVFETDAPYLSPQKVRGETNEPANVRHIYEFCAPLLERSVEELSEIILENAKALYNITL